MKKTLIFTYCLLILLLCSACVDFYPLRIDGILESETPQMQIVVSEDATKFGNDGELTDNNGAIVKIVFTAMHGDFIIYKFQEDEQYGINSTILFSGKYKLKGDTLILNCDDGSKIILKKVENLANTLS